ncbi:hypothetical protein SAMN06273570_4257 [Candidatus Pantoea floridensis]|uniref:Uncharacterized protein n=1 Tax=Candidatus Pantoea floridensis TaxID=1938870 RepID=A0A286DKZ7_9GAMM|nr:hypothetical protein BX596_3958 [Enterobacteriaceae bacterium JKS000233]SOD59368.1 hypothetical protein SAMN06273570_4257 [Pantoea floridensis]
MPLSHAQVRINAHPTTSAPVCGRGAIYGDQYALS